MKNLSALVHFKLLEKESSEIKINSNERFKFNSTYSEKRRKIALPFTFAEESFKRGITLITIFRVNELGKRDSN